MAGFRFTLLTTALSAAASLLAAQQHVQVRTRTQGWPSGWIVREEPTRLGMVLDYHTDTLWIPMSEIVAVEQTGAPTLAGAPQITAGSARGPRVKLITGDKSREQHIGILAVRDSARYGLVLDGRRDTTWLDRSAVTDAQISVGHKSASGTGAGLGTIGGALLGGVLAANSYKPCQPQPGLLGGVSCIGDPGQGGATLLGALGGAIGGALLGAAIGSGFKTERWEHLDQSQLLGKTKPRIGIMPIRRGAVISVSLTLR
jgi:hypothetical protein